MTDRDARTRQSFERQVGLFTGPDALFARRATNVPGWLGPLDSGAVVLDVACGGAHVAEQVAPHVRQVVGIDLTPALLEAGAERLRAAAVDNVLLQEGNAEHLPFAGESFDLVVCRTALHHFAHAEHALAEMHRVCRPGGRVVVADMIPPDAHVRAQFDAVHRALDPSHVHARLARELVALVETYVGPVAAGGAEERVEVPIDIVCTEVADRDLVLTALRDDLDGGAPTGFEPRELDEQILVTFTIAVVAATRR